MSKRHQARRAQSRPQFHRLALLAVLLATGCASGTPAAVSALAAPPRAASTDGATAPVAAPVKGSPAVRVQRPGSEAPQLAQVGRASADAVATEPSEDWMLELAPGVTPAAFAAQPLPLGARVAGTVRLARRYLVQLDLPAGVDTADLGPVLLALPGVVSARRLYQRVAAEPGVGRRRAASLQNEPVPDLLAGLDPAEGQWGHLPLFADTAGAWEAVPPAAQRNTFVAVIDSGLDLGHPAFTGRVIDPLDFAQEPPSSDVSDVEGHGTHVAGIIGASGEDDDGVAGVAWGVPVMPLAWKDEFDIMQALVAAIEHRPSEGPGRVRVINMSLGSDPFAQTDLLWAELMQRARAAGILVVAVAGNSARPVPDDPGNYPNVLSVGATGHYLSWELPAYFTSFGADLVAPGEAILSTFPRQLSRDGRAVLSGTSMSAPYVAGVAALMFAKYDPTNVQMNRSFVDRVERQILATADDLGDPGPDPIMGHGRVNARAALAPDTLPE